MQPRRLGQPPGERRSSLPKEVGREDPGIAERGVLDLETGSLEHGLQQPGGSAVLLSHVGRQLVRRPAVLRAGRALIDACGEEERVCWARGLAVAEGDAPQAADDWAATFLSENFGDGRINA